MEFLKQNHISFYTVMYSTLKAKLLDNFNMRKTHKLINGNKFFITGLLYLFPCERAHYVCIAETETQVWKLRPGNAKNGQGQVRLR